mmetsp:Transcript_95247/g.226840  ORF Transcript_95247/g.226840 Transcript_95247/m.226840 type:complete len:333 (-) Transcript_95247:214-1212(-)
MRSGEGGVDQAAGPRVPLRDFELGAVLRDPDGLLQAIVAHLGVDALGEKVQGQRHQAHVAGALAIAKEAALHSVCSCHDGELRRRDAGAPVVVGVDADAHAVSLLDVSTHPLDLVSVHIRSRHFYGAGKVQDDLVLWRGFPHVHHPVAHVQREVELRAGEALGGVLQAHVGASHALLDQLLHQPHALDRQVLDLLATLFEDDPALQLRGGVVDMNHHVLRAFHPFDGAEDQGLPALGQDLNPAIIWDKALFNDVANEVEVRLAGSWKAHLNLLVAQLQQVQKQPQLLLMVHRVDQRLVAIAQVNRAPARCLGEALLRPGALGPILVKGYLVP